MSGLEFVGSGNARSAGSDSSPGTPLVFGTDIALLNGWDVPPPGDGDFPARVYAQGGRAYVTGLAIAGSAAAVCVFPADFDVELFGVDPDDFLMEISVRDGSVIKPAQLTVSGGRVHLAIPGSAAGHYVDISAIQWPLAT